jgi:very-short-patch-repair endonuclease
LTEPKRERRLRIRPDRTQRARVLRKNATFPERLLWSRLRGGQLGGLRFRRQAAIGPFFADFYCAAASLVIELDGLSHDDSRDRDAQRTEFLKRQGLRAIRFQDDEVVKDLENVMFRIECEIGLHR